MYLVYHTQRTEKGEENVHSSSGVEGYTQSAKTAFLKKKKKKSVSRKREKEKSKRWKK